MSIHSPTDIMQNPAFASLRKTPKAMNTSRNNDDLEAQRRYQPSSREGSLLSDKSSAVDPDSSTLCLETPTRDCSFFIYPENGKQEKAPIRHMSSS